MAFCKGTGGPRCLLEDAETRSKARIVSRAVTEALSAHDLKHLETHIKNGGQIQVLIIFS